MSKSIGLHNNPSVGKKEDKHLPQYSILLELEYYNSKELKGNGENIGRKALWINQ